MTNIIVTYILYSNKYKKGIIHMKYFGAFLASGFILIIVAVLPKNASAVQFTHKCVTTVVTDVGSGTVWTGQTCWWEAAGGGGGGSSSPDPLPGGTGSGISDGSDAYVRNEFDTDGDYEFDCWKDVVENGDYYLDSGDDFGTRILNGEPDAHNGIDIQAPHGTIIRSPAYGKVKEVSMIDDSPNGAFVRIRYIKNQVLYEAVMIHMIEGSPSVSPGDVVYPGQPVGAVNSTGASDGHHVHFEVKVITTPISPDGINPITRKPYNYMTLGPVDPVDPVARMGGSTCEKNQ
ncbi:M23 family metallopeptidase [Idiomarina sp. HP20-50]|uniref:M23 family metallopeptidase n=1 Tax=Idiomarina sp. HP20-50 TaxID=3070813 RepID=UPI00294AA951|nr:M23 family metallopeptidase [Idiomarina sp. HP20-50]MDV6317210.1 M23 family metallopeptidase [Idiomarina sp. HP20-50]